MLSVCDGGLILGTDPISHPPGEGPPQKEADKQAMMWWWSLSLCVCVKPPRIHTKAVKMVLPHQDGSLKSCLRSDIPNREISNFGNPIKNTSQMCKQFSGTRLYISHSDVPLAPSTYCSCLTFCCYTVKIARRLNR